MSFKITKCTDLEYFDYFGIPLQLPTWATRIETNPNGDIWCYNYDPEKREEQPFKHLNHMYLGNVEFEGNYKESLVAVNND